MNLGTITDTLSWYKLSSLNGIRVKPKLHRRRRRIYESLQKPSQKPKVIHTDNLLEFGKYSEELSWNYRTTTLHRSETSGVAERAARRANEETPSVLLQSGSDDKWWSDSMKCYCCLRDDQDLLADGKSQNERRFGESFQDMLCSRCGIWEEDILTAEIEELEKLDASEICPRRLNAKEVLITQKDGEFVCLVADGSAKRKRLRIPRTHSETGIHRKERESQRRISRVSIGKSFDPE